jgi:hypothetical protein
MRPFTKHEIIGVSIIIIIVGIFFTQGILMSLLRAGDAERMGDLNTISNGLTAFYESFGFFPPSEDGKIKACKGESFDGVLEQLKKSGKFDRTLFVSGLRACEWGHDPLSNLVTDDQTPYVQTLPRDPQTSSGLSYTYLSNGNRFQVLAHLESQEDFYDPTVASRNIACGNMICNVGKAYANTPLDRSIEQYEDELRQKNTSGK